MKLPLYNSNRTQRLLTEAKIRKIPPLYGQDGKGDGAIVHLKFFIEGYTWYITELDPNAGIAFAFVVHVGGWPEMGYVNLNELATMKGNLGQGVERDIYWKPCTVGAVKIKERVPV